MAVRSGLPNLRAAAAHRHLEAVLLASGIFMGAVSKKPRQGRDAFAKRLRLEEMLSRLSGAFVHLPSTEMHRALDEWLGRFGEHMGFFFFKQKTAYEIVR